MGLICLSFPVSEFHKSPRTYLHACFCFKICSNTFDKTATFGCETDEETVTLNECVMVKRLQKVSGVRVGWCAAFITHPGDTMGCKLSEVVRGAFVCMLSLQCHLSCLFQAVSFTNCVFCMWFYPVCRQTRESSCANVFLLFAGSSSNKWPLKMHFTPYVKCRCERQSVAGMQV